MEGNGHETNRPVLNLPRYSKWDFNQFPLGITGVFYVAVASERDHTSSRILLTVLRYL